VYRERAEHILDVNTFGHQLLGRFEEHLLITEQTVYLFMMAHLGKLMIS
jgi:hypothetical protein